MATTQKKWKNIFEDEETAKFFIKLATITKYIQKVKEAGVLFTKEPKTSNSNIKITISKKFIGNPEINPNGIPYETIKKTTATNSIIQKLCEIEPITEIKGIVKNKEEPLYLIPFRFVQLTPENTMTEITTIQYQTINSGEIITNESEIDDDTSTLDFYLIPTSKVTKVYQPVYLVLNFDRSLSSPGEYGTIYKYYPLVNLRDFQGLTLNLLLWHIFCSFTKEEVLFLRNASNTNVGQQVYTMVKNTLGEEYVTNAKTLYKKVQDIIQDTSMLKWAVNAIARQLTPASYRSYLSALATQQQIIEDSDLNTLDSLYNRIHELCLQNPPITQIQLTNVTETRYKIKGTTCVSETEKISMSSNGQFISCDNDVQPLLTNSLIQSLKVYKQRVFSKSFFTTIFEDDVEVITDPIMNKNINIPCSSWEDVKAFDHKATVIQKSITTIKNDVENISDMINNIERINSYNSTLVNASFSYTPLKKEMTSSLTLMDT